jgi:hypothetical protein
MLNQCQRGRRQIQRDNNKKQLQHSKVILLQAGLRPVRTRKQTTDKNAAYIASCILESQDKVDPDYDGDTYNEKKERKEEAEFLHENFGDPNVEEDVCVEDEEYLPDDDEDDEDEDEDEDGS